MFTVTMDVVRFHCGVSIYASLTRTLKCSLELIAKADIVLNLFVFSLYDQLRCFIVWGKVSKLTNHL